MKSFSLLPKNKEQKSTKKNKNNIINFNYTQNYEDIIRDILNKDSKITSQKLTNCNSKYNLNGQGNEKDSDKKNNKENLYKKYDKKNAKTTKNKQFKNEKNEIKYRRSPTLRQDYTINLKNFRNECESRINQEEFNHNNEYPYRSKEMQEQK